MITQAGTGTHGLRHGQSGPALHGGSPSHTRKARTSLRLGLGVTVSPGPGNASAGCLRLRREVRPCPPCGYVANLTRFEIPRPGPRLPSYTHTNTHTHTHKCIYERKFYVYILYIARSFHIRKNESKRCASHHHDRDGVPVSDTLEEKDQEEEEGEEEEKEEGLFKANAVNEEDPERDRVTQV